MADTTWGKGAFWKHVPEGYYEVLASDLNSGVDARNLPYADDSLDAVVFDPPYMHSSGGTSYQSGGNKAFSDHYKNNDRPSDGHQAVLDLYFQASIEAFRVLRKTGVYIVKTQDEVCANRQRLTHVEVINYLESTGWICEDLFVLGRENKPVTARVIKQLHARKNHSYYLVFRKAPPVGRKVWTGPSSPPG